MAGSAGGRGRVERGIVVALLAGFAAVPLALAPAYVGGAEPLGEDSSSHVFAAATLAGHLRERSPGWWMPHLNLGFPLVHYYQPLPHVATACAALALGGPEHATTAYKLWVVTLLALLPGAGYLGLRRLGLERTGALVGALALASLSAPKAYFGLTARHFLLVGLYTLLFGAVVAPLALAEGVRFLQGRGRLWLAVLTFTIAFLCHGLIGLGLVPVFVFVAFLGQGERIAWGRRAARLVLLGGATLLCLSFWLLPQLTTAEYFGGWPLADEERFDGFGLASVLEGWLGGRLVDLRRPPLVAGLSALGALAAALTLRRALSRVALFGLATFVVLSAGRESFGPALDVVFPPNARIEGGRWLACLHLFLALAAGLGAQSVLSLLRRRTPLAARPLRATVSSSVLLLVVAGLRLPGWVADLSWGLDTIPAAMDRPALAEIARTLAALPPDGRTYTAEPLGHQSHWAMAGLGLLAGRPMTLSFGVGVQDSLGFLFAYAFRPLDPERGAAQARLLNVRYLLVGPGVDVTHLGGRYLARRGPYSLVRLPGDYGYFDVVSEPLPTPDAPPAELAPLFWRWMAEGYPRGARFLRLPRPVAASLPGLPSAAPGDAERPAEGGAVFAPAPSQPPGEVLEESAGDWWYRARLRATHEGAWALLKVTPHPYWRASVDGERRRIHHLSPAFMGLPLEAGEHRVAFEFVAPAWQRGLLGVPPLVLAACWLAQRRRQRPE